MPPDVAPLLKLCTYPFKLELQRRWSCLQMVLAPPIAPIVLLTTASISRGEQDSDVPVVQASSPVGSLRSPSTRVAGVG